MKDTELRKALEEADVIYSADSPSPSDWRKTRLKDIERRYGESNMKFNALLDYLGLRCRESVVVIEKIKKEAK